MTDISPIALLGRHCLPALLPPYAEFGQWPTPVERLDAFSRAVGAQVWVKREDLSCTEYGGNKIRKLEFLFGEALARRSRRVVTVGGIGSNHVIATAVHGRRFGLTTHAVVFPQPVDDKVREGLQLLCDLGVRFHPVRGRPLVPLAVARAMGDLDDATYIAPGGSSATGALGWVCAGLEIGRQVASGEIPAFDAAFVPLGSAGTYCGLVIGLQLAGLTTEVWGVRVVEGLYMNEAVVRVLLHATARLLARSGVRIDPMAVASRPLKIVDDQIGRGYGVSTEAARRAVEMMATTEGLDLEATYSGKALAGLIEACRGTLAGRRVLFIDTFNSRPVGSITRKMDHVELPATLAGWLRR